MNSWEFCKRGFHSRKHHGTNTPDEDNSREIHPTTIARVHKFQGLVNKGSEGDCQAPGRWQSSPVMLEICIDGMASALAAERSGADRVELCANLPEGGTTPSAGMIRAVRRVFSRGVMVIIRPRGYDFLYSEEEMEVMLDDIRVARELGADGVVIGCLKADGTVDAERCARLIDAAGPLDITFHRAFDMTRDLGEALEAIVALGVKRILTSGGKADVPAGIAVISELVKQSAGRISLMPGGGVTPENLAEIVTSTGVQEIHLSARHSVKGGMQFRNEACSMGTFSKDDEYCWREASEELIRRSKAALLSSVRL